MRHVSSTVALVEVCEKITDGTHYTPPALTSGYPFLTVKNITERGLDFSDCIWIDESEFTRASDGDSIPQEGDVLFSKDGTVGKVYVVNGNQRFAVLSSIAILRPDRTKILSEYLGACLRNPSVLAQAVSRKTGSAIRRIILRDLKRVHIALPPLEGQRRIVDILNHAASIRRLREQAKANAKELIPALFLDMFGDPATNPKGWEMSPLVDVVAAFEGGKNLQSGPAASDGYRILKISSVTSGYFRPKESKPAPLRYVPPQTHIVGDGDFLFSRANTVELVGSVAIVRNPPDGLLLPDKIWRLRWKTPFAVQPQYMLALFQDRSTRRAMAKLATGTSDSMRNISQGRLKSLRLPIPPLSQQEIFAERVADIQGTIDQMDRAAAAAEQLQAALMARLFAGE